MFSGSYLADDTTFLLKPVRLEPTELAEKERLIQTGQRHYSEMIARETLPSPRYLDVFHQALAHEKTRFAGDVLCLARHLAELRDGPITLVSLARAGTPIGALLARTLRLLGRTARHYSVSIIRDRGIDENALRFIIDINEPKSVVFVDGWTGKGVIARELQQAVTSFNARHGTQLDPGLYTVADLCGVAKFAASIEDYLIPSCVLGATISGLVSRSILNEQVIGPDDFHGCLFYEDWIHADLSRWFIDDVFAEIRQQKPAPQTRVGFCRDQSSARASTSADFLRDIQRRLGVNNLNHIKPGLGEATRVLLRRVPDCLLVRDLNCVDVAHLLLLAHEKKVPVIVEPALPYAAAALIKELEG